MDKNITIELCMGSSCFARGNSENLQAIEVFLSERGLSDRVELVGHLCLGKCKVADAAFLFLCKFIKNTPCGFIYRIDDLFHIKFFIAIIY